MAEARSTVRVFRTRGRESRLLLDVGADAGGARDGLWDLSAFLEKRGQPTDLVDLFEADWFSASSLEKLLPGGKPGTDWVAADVPRDAGGPLEVDVPLRRSEVGKILALGKNFRAHAAEFDEPVPAEPLFFNKLPETVVHHGAEVTVPAWYTGRVDHEAELAAVVGLAGRDIALEDAMEHVAGYTVANDLTARSLQGADREQRHPWFRAKNLDGFCPLGPCFVPRDFLSVDDLRVTCRVNGELRQDASTADWVVDLPHALAWLSRHLTLHPGDVVLMGTPAGVGPLDDGDEVVCAVEGIGELATRIRRPAAR